MAGEPTAGRRLPFSQKQRLERAWEFDKVRREGQRVVKGCLILNWRVADGTAGASRLGVVTSRKIGDAVVRSRARRLLREVFRQHQHDFAKPLEIVLVARQSIAEKDYAGVESDFLNAARQGRILREVQ
jgi:ribonuclease P protein component